MTSACEPITFVTLDGAERKFSLSNARAIEVARRTREGFRNGDMLDFVWIACDEKRPCRFVEGVQEFYGNDIPEDAGFVELFPIHDSEVMQGLIKAITDEWQKRTKTSPLNDKFRPPKPIQLPTGSDS